MKRGKGLTRRVPLRSKTPLVGSSPLARASRLTRSVMARKRPVVTPEERAARKTVGARSGGRCEVCQNANGTNMHHRRKAARVWTPENLLHVCGHGNSMPGCHSLIELSPEYSRKQGWIVPSHRNPADVPCWLAGHEFVFLTNTGHIITDPEEAA